VKKGRRRKHPQQTRKVENALRRRRDEWVGYSVSHKFLDTTTLDTKWPPTLLVLCRVGHNTHGPPRSFQNEMQCCLLGRRWRLVYGRSSNRPVSGAGRAEDSLTRPSSLAAALDGSGLPAFEHRLELLLPDVLDGVEIRGLAGRPRSAMPSATTWFWHTLGLYLGSLSCIRTQSRR